MACYYQAHPQDLSQMVHVPEDKIVEGGMLCHLAQRDLMPGHSGLDAVGLGQHGHQLLIDFIGFAKMAAWFEAEFAHLHLGRYLMEVTDRENYLPLKLP